MVWRGGPVRSTSLHQLDLHHGGGRRQGQEIGTAGVQVRNEAGGADRMGGLLAVPVEQRDQRVSRQNRDELV